MILHLVDFTLATPSLEGFNERYTKNLGKLDDIDEDLTHTVVWKGLVNVGEIATETNPMRTHGGLGDIEIIVVKTTKVL